ncbi:hypothetical protein JG688_00012264, partial [Phytophthora aleatoria]
GFLLAQVNATSAGGTTFKTAPPTRPDVVRWITCSWTSLTQATIPGGFKKAKLTIATVLPPPQSTPHAPPESDLGSLVRLLQLSNVAVEAIDPAKDIDHDELDGEASSDEGWPLGKY